MSAEREPVSKRLRFEVFKRDSFACQYCGKKAPDVVLHCDHVVPVMAGGQSDILNLITSCAACNGGKGAVLLSDTAALDKQRDVLADLEERRQQIEMMLQWRDELRSLSDDTVKQIVARIEERGPGYTVSEQGIANIRRWLLRHGVAEILSGIDAAFDTYAEFEGEKITSASWSKAFAKVPGVIGIQKQEADRPHLRRLFYIRGILKKRTGATIDLDFLEHLILNGWDVDYLEQEAKSVNYITHFTKGFEDVLKRIGRPYPGGRPWV